MGFATKDNYGSRSTTLQAAGMIVFSQDECNENLANELAKNDQCELIYLKKD